VRGGGGVTRSFYSAYAPNAASSCPRREQLPNRLGRAAREVIIDERQHGHTLAEEPDRLGIGPDLLIAADDNAVPQCTAKALQPA
jgi:hypothetical protein